MLGWDELRLTLEESGGIVRLRRRGKTPKEMIRRLHEATDGWAAGLVLMLESLKRGIEPHLPGMLTSEEILNYFGSELFNKTDNEIQDFLLKTAFLPKTTVKMAEALTGVSNADSILSALNRNNNFTQKHYSAEPVYQYHQLFREFLLFRAKEIYSSAILSDLQHRAAILLEEAGQIEDAAILYRDAGDWDAMVQLIMKQAPSMLEQGRYRPLEEWLDSLPKEMLENDPWLLYWKGASRFPFDPSQAQSYFEEAFEQFRMQGNLPGFLLAWSGVVNSIVYSQEDFSRLDRWIQLFPELPENPEGSIPREVWIRVVSSMVTALTYRHPEHPEAEKWVRRADSIAQGPGSPLAKVPILFHLAHRYLVVGDYKESSITIRSMQHLANSKEALPSVLIFTRMAEAMHSQLVGDHEKCLKAVFEGLKTSQLTGIFFLDRNLIGHAVSSCQNVGDLGMAQTMIERMVSSSDQLPLFEKSFCYFLQTRQYLLRSEFEAASRQAELGLRTTKDTGFYIGLGLNYLLAAQVMHKVGKQQAAWSYLREAFRLAERFRSKIYEYNGLMIEAHFHFEEGDEASGLTSLRKALTIGKEGGFLNTFVDQPAITTRLCIKALEEGIEVPYVQEIIRKRRLIPEKPPLHLENWPWPLKIYTLGKFELLKDGKPIQFSGKVQKKPLEMLKVLVAFGGKNIGEEQIADLLWPEADGDAAYSAFTTNLSRLRHLLGNERVIRVQHGRMTIDAHSCWVDAFAFERMVSETEKLWKENSGEIVGTAQKALNLYQGHFLASEGDPFWAVSCRERLRDKYLRLATKIGDQRKKSEQWAEALNCFLTGLEVDPLVEEFYQQVMVCYEKLDQRTRAIEVYQRCKRVLASNLGCDPSPKTKAIYRSLRTDSGTV
jgi:DNA-binding SARP family transcriptional activator